MQNLTKRERDPERERELRQEAKEQGVWSSDSNPRPTSIPCYKLKLTPATVQRHEAYFGAFSGAQENFSVTEPCIHPSDHQPTNPGTEADGLPNSLGLGPTVRQRIDRRAGADLPTPGRPIRVCLH